MTFRLETMFTGLCYFHLAPKDDDDQELNQAHIVLVDATRRKSDELARTHAPWLCVSAVDVENPDHWGDGRKYCTDDEVWHMLAPRRDGENDLLVDLRGKAARFRFETTGNKQLRAPRRPIQEGERYGEDPRDRGMFHWVPSLRKVLGDDANLTLKAGCLTGDLSDPSCPATSRIEVDRGSLESGRIHMDGQFGTVWSFRPALGDGQRWAQSLTDQVLWEAGNLESVEIEFSDGTWHTVVNTLKLRPKHGRRLRLSITNLPTDITMTDQTELSHFGWFYELLEYPPASRPIPNLPSSFGPSRVGRIEAGNAFCPPASG